MERKLELVASPVTDVDRAKAFCTDQVGFNTDRDHVGHLVMPLPLHDWNPCSACIHGVGRGS